MWCLLILLCRAWRQNSQTACRQLPAVKSRSVAVRTDYNTQQSVMFAVPARSLAHWCSRFGNMAIESHCVLAKAYTEIVAKGVNMYQFKIFVSRLPSEHLDEQLCRWKLIGTTQQPIFIICMCKIRLFVFSTLYDPQMRGKRWSWGLIFVSLEGPYTISLSNEVISISRVVFTQIDRI